MKILVIGDVHNEFKMLNQVISKTRPDLVLACGDFGYWPRLDNAYSLSEIKTQGSVIRWCDGNHEDFFSLEQRSTNELEPNVIYMPRGSTYTLPDGRTIMFFGGAFSIDKAWRTIGHTWFPQETIAQRDFINLPKTKVDIFITHTCPLELLPTLLPYNEFKANDPSNAALSRLWEMYKPKMWFFGHWHKYLTGQLNDTQWHCLAEIGSDERYIMWLPDF